MTTSTDDPFTMDEDLSELPNNEETSVTTATNTSETSNGIRDPNYSIHQSPNSIYVDTKLIRSKLDQIKLEEKETNATTTEEDDEKTYDEDADDKLDLQLQKQLLKQYKDEHKQNDEIDSNKFNFDYNDDQPLTPPENFALVIGSIYRSSFPQPNNFSFLRGLGLKSVLCLIPEDYPELQQQWLQNENIKLFQLGMSGNKEPFVKISSDLITQAIKIVLNPENQPILIHCNRGKHRTGCLVGVLRRLQNWSKTIIFDEYRKFAAPKERSMDQQFIELYDDTELKQFCNERNLIPLKWD
ncbi:SIW14 [Candida pseudojiufengensis]|uniref:SIW14 n=1 Tax=Candida pseudojiufengensis TaxID=497109 RepID=UPI00222558E2|nr:SIW14 [Candida pseudojiufengensis]KAI5962342.1 SIW14 [Candida pseudojiufengensis]